MRKWPKITNEMYKVLREKKICLTPPFNAKELNTGKKLLRFGPPSRMPKISCFADFSPLFFGGGGRQK